MKNSSSRMLLLAFLVVGMICGGFTHNLAMLICFGVLAVAWGIFISVSAVFDNDNTALREYKKFRDTCGYNPYDYDFPYYIVKLNNRRLMNLYRGLKIMRKNNFQEHSSLREEEAEQRLNAELDNLLEITKNEIVYRVDRKDF